MKSLEKLHNSGIAKLGQGSNEHEKTVVVLGVGRGGTSLCARVLHEIGISTGGDSRPPTFEDLPLSKALEKHDFQTVEKLVSEYNSEHKIWAFKRPTTNDTVETLHTQLRNPHYIVIFRDVLAIAVRNKVSMRRDFLESMKEAIKDYNKILDFLRTHKPPSLLCSYEKVLQTPEIFVEEVIGFLHLSTSVNPAARARATDSIKPSPPDYLEKTNAIDFYGYLDTADTTSISGWAAHDQSSAPVELILRVNNVPVVSFLAKSMRQDVANKGLHPTGFCGFELQYPPHLKVKSNDQISVSVKETGIELRNSPRMVE